MPTPFAALCLLMGVPLARGACVYPGCLAAAARPAGGLASFPAHSARRALSTCELPGESFYFSAVTDGPAQIAGENNMGAVHIGGQLTLSPFYAQKVRLYILPPRDGPPARRSTTPSPL